jgi:glycosyltransferase involved in cell wall biosynthesis
VSKPAARRPRILVPIRHPVGGIQTWCKYYYGHPAFREYDIEIIAPMSEECLQLQQMMQPLGIPIRVTGSSLRDFAASTWRAIASGRWDLVHAHGFSAAVVCTPVARLFGVPCLVTQHEVVLENQYVDRRGKLIRAATRAALALATRIHAVSQSAAANLRLMVRGREATCRRITVISNAIDSKLFYEAPTADLRAELGLEASDFIIGFFGRFMMPKGFATLLDAVDQLRSQSPPPPRRIVVVAVGSGAYRAREERKIASMGLQANFRFLDFRPLVASLIKAVDVVAVPSLWEACGLIAMETLTCGIPLICSNCDALVEVTAQTPATVFPIKNSTALARAIQSHMAVDHRAAAREFAPIAARRYSAEPFAAEMAALYRELIDRGH